MKFSPDRTTQAITVDTKEDALVENDETFHIFITDDDDKLTGNGHPLDFLARATGTIRDDDERTTTTPRIWNRGTEEGDPIIFTVTLDRAPDSTVTYYSRRIGAPRVAGTTPGTPPPH